MASGSERVSVTALSTPPLIATAVRVGEWRGPEHRADRGGQRVSDEVGARHGGSLQEAQPAEILGKPLGVRVDDPLAVQPQAHGSPVAAPRRVTEQLHPVRVRPPPMPGFAGVGRYGKSRRRLRKRAHGRNRPSPRYKNVLHPDETCGDLVNLENQVGYLRAVGNASSPTRIPFHLLLVQLYGRRPRTGSSTWPHLTAALPGLRSHVRGLTPNMPRRRRCRPPEHSVSRAFQGHGRHVRLGQPRAKTPAKRQFTHRPLGP